MPEAERVIPQLVIIFLSIALHEFGHAKSADAAGDPTPRMMGRVTLNPFAHFDPLGSIMVIITVFSGFGIGWGKPVMVDPRNMQNPRWDHFMSVLWGPLTNVILAVVCAAVFRVAFVNGLSPLDSWMFFAVVINLALAFFNLLPLGPLDGHWLFGALLPPHLGVRFIQFSRTYGLLILLALVFGGQIMRQAGQPSPLEVILWNPVLSIAELLLGVKLT